LRFNFDFKDVNKDIQSLRPEINDLKNLDQHLKDLLVTFNYIQYNGYWIHYEMNDKEKIEKQINEMYKNDNEEFDVAEKKHKLLLDALKNINEVKKGFLKRENNCHLFKFTISKEGENIFCDPTIECAYDPCVGVKKYHYMTKNSDVVNYGEDDNDDRNIIKTAIEKSGKQISKFDLFDELIILDELKEKHRCYQHYLAEYEKNDNDFTDSVQSNVDTYKFQLKNHYFGDIRISVKKPLSSDHKDTPVSIKYTQDEKDQLTKVEASELFDTLVNRQVNISKLKEIFEYIEFDYNENGIMTITNACSLLDRLDYETTYGYDYWGKDFKIFDMRMSHDVGVFSFAVMGKNKNNNMNVFVTKEGNFTIEVDSQELYRGDDVQKFKSKFGDVMKKHVENYGWDEKKTE